MIQQTEKPLTVTKIHLNDFKRITAVEISPKDNLVILGGNNAQGKSSVLDGMMACFCGEKSRPLKAVRDGAEQAKVTVELGTEGKVELVVSLTIPAEGEPRLTIKRADGGVITKPQQYLDALTGGSFSFDPLEFTRSKPADQRETLMELAGLDFSDLDGRRKAAFDDRTVVNRQTKEAEAQLKAAPWHADAPAAEVSAAEVSKRLQEATDAESKFKLLEGQYKNTKQRIETGKQLISDIEKQVTEAEKQVAALRKKHAEATKLLTELEGQAEKEKAAAEDIPDYPVESIRKELAAVEQTNVKVRANAKHLELKDKLKKLEAEESKLTEAIKACDAEKAKLLADAKFPITGLGVDDNGVTFKGIPFAQASQAEKVKVSVAMAIALNPRLRVVQIREGALLDTASKMAVAEMAAEFGVQVWMEDVGVTPLTTIEVVDGTAHELVPMVPSAYGAQSQIEAHKEQAAREAAKPRKRAVSA